MTFDERIKDGLRTDPDGDWPRAPYGDFKRRARRATRARAAGAVVALAAVVAAVVLVVPRLNNTTDEGFVGPGGGKVTTFHDEQFGYSVDVPPGWKVQVAQVGGMFSIQTGRAASSSITFTSLPEQPRNYEDVSEYVQDDLRTRGGNDPTEPKAVEIGGRRAVEISYTLADDSCRQCENRQWIVDWGNHRVLHFSILATPDRLDELPSAVASIFGSINRSVVDAKWDYAGWVQRDVPLTQPLDPGKGVAPSVATRRLLQFLEARVRGSGADGWMAGPGPAAGTEWLYVVGGKKITEYRVLDFLSDSSTLGNTPNRYVVCMAGTGGTALALETIELQSDAVKVARVTREPDPRDC